MSNQSIQSWYSIRRKTAQAAAASGALAAAEIYIYGDIGESWWEETVSAAAFVRDLNALDVEQITVRINSIGGSVPDGLAIFNAIRRHKATVTTEVDGMAFSIASLIAMAGDKVHMAGNAMLMIHAPWTYAAGNSSELRETADQLDTWAAAMSTSYALRTGDQPGALALLTDGKDHYYTAEEALQAKFIDAVTDPMPIAASASRDLPISRYRSLPASLQARGIPAAAAAQPSEQSMSNTVPSAANPNPPAAPATPVAAQPDPQALRAQVLAEDQARRGAIRASFEAFTSEAGVGELLARCENDVACSAEHAGKLLLAHLGKTMAPAVGSVRTVEDEVDKHRSAMTTAILARSAVVLSKDGVVRADSSNPFRGHKLLDIARACLIQAGARVEGMDQRALVAAAFTQSRSDFPVLLENVLHKTLQGAYALQADTWSRFCKRGQVSDFRPHKRYRVGSLSNLDAKNELGEYRNKTIPDGERATISAGTKGNLINISREMIIDDDLDAFTGLAAAMGRAAKRTVEADVYAALALNSGMGPTLDDGVTLFHANHFNVSTGAPTVASFEAARVVMSAQKDVGGNDFLALSPAVWLGPDGISGQARVVVNSTYDPDAANKLQRANIAAGMVREVVGSPRLAGTPWYFFADPNEAPVLEVAFLDGVDTPYVEWQDGFTVDGVRGKVRMDYGVAGCDFRGAVRSTGA